MHKSCYPSHLMIGTRIQCYSCSFGTNILHCMQQHFRQKHLPPKFTCIVAQTSTGVCGQRFCSKQSVLNHVEKHFRHMQTGTFKKRRIVTPADHDTESDTETDDQDSADQSDEPASRPERVTASPEKADPAATPQSVTAPESEQDNLLRITLTQLLDQLFHCSGCSGYFVTDNDLHQHYSAHSHVPEREEADSSDCNVRPKCEMGDGDHKRHLLPDLVVNERQQCDTITLD